MKFATFRYGDGEPEAGIVLGGQIRGLGAAGFSSVQDVIDRWEGAQEAIAAYLASPQQEPPLSVKSVKLLAPLPRPTKLICVGLNYRDHAAEANMEIPKVPTIFSKFSSCVIGPGDEVVLPRNSTKPDYEAEFAFVIGKRGRHVPAEKWSEYVFGYTIVNDVSARDFQLATSQWLMGKTFDTFAPMGPWIVTKDEIEDPHNLGIQMKVNGETLQDSSTKELIFRIPELIAYISSVFTLEPGDVVSTGTPAGVGFGHKPPRWLKAGDECVITIEKIGQLRNTVVAES